MTQTATSSGHFSMPPLTVSSRRVDGDTSCTRSRSPDTTITGASHWAATLPATAHGVRVSGDPDRVVRRVALCGGAGDFLLDELAAGDADVYLTSDLRHHRAGEFLEESRMRGGPALVDVAHWAAEWTWLPVAERVLTAALAGQGITVETRVSTIVTDPWTGHVTMIRGAPR